MPPFKSEMGQAQSYIFPQYYAQWWYVAGQWPCRMAMDLNNHLLSGDVPREGSILHICPVCGVWADLLCASHSRVCSTHSDAQHTMCNKGLSNYVSGSCNYSKFLSASLCIVIPFIKTERFLLTCTETVLHLRFLMYYLSFCKLGLKVTQEMA